MPCFFAGDFSESRPSKAGPVAPCGDLRGLYLLRLRLQPRREAPLHEGRAQERARLGLREGERGAALLLRGVRAGPGRQAGRGERRVPQPLVAPRQP